MLHIDIEPLCQKFDRSWLWLGEDAVMLQHLHQNVGLIGMIPDQFFADGVYVADLPELVGVLVYVRE